MNQVSNAPTGQPASHLRLTFDVSGLLDNIPGVLPISAHLFFPTNTSPYLPSLWAYLIHGGSYDWHYWDLEVPGYPPDAYSVARYMARHGIGVIAVDSPGAGEIRWPVTGDKLVLEVLAEAHYQAIQQMRARLVSGDLIPGLAPVQHPRIVIMGHSMGGATGVALAGLHPECCDALAVLGWTNQSPIIPRVDMMALMPHLMPDANGDIHLPRKLMRPAFYLPDVPMAVIEADERLATTMPGIASLNPAPYAKSISIPVLSLFGEVDNATTPELEPGTYPAAASHTLYVVQGSANCHALSGVRETVDLLLLRWLWEHSK